MFRNVTMKCLTEIAGVTVTHYDEKFVGELSSEKPYCSCIKGTVKLTIIFDPE